MTAHTERTTRDTFYCPIELTGQRHAHLPPERRFFFIVIKASSVSDACFASRKLAISLMGGTYGYSRWAPLTECPTIEHMVSLRRGFDKARGRVAPSRNRQMVEV